MVQLVRRTAMSGKMRTWKKRTDRTRQTQWEFNLTRNKSLELRNFFLSYAATEMKVVDHMGRTWRGYVTNNPVEFRVDRRAGPAIQGWSEGAAVSVRLEFEGKVSDLKCTFGQIYNFNIADTHGTDDSVSNDPDFPVIPGLLNHWDANSTFGASPDGTQVAAWTDIVGTADFGLIGFGVPYGAIVRKITAGSELTFLEPNGGTGSRLRATIPQWFYNRRGTLFTVINQQFDITASTGFKKVWSGPPSPDNSLYIPHDWQASNPGTASLSHFDTSLVDVEGGGTLPQNTRHIMTLNHDTDTNMMFRRNGLERSGRTVNDTIGELDGAFDLGDVMVGQMLYYSRSLTTSEMESVETYLSQRWAIPLE